MIVCENCALFECIRDRCKKTGIGKVFWIAQQTLFAANFFIISFTVFLLGALMHEFAQVSQAIIHGAVQIGKRPPPPQFNFSASRSNWRTRFKLFKSSQAPALPAVQARMSSCFIFEGSCSR
jgi:hypothetical protein